MGSVNFYFTDEETEPQGGSMIFAHTWEEAELGCKPRPDSNSSALFRGPVASQRPGCQACSADG